MALVRQRLAESLAAFRAVFRNPNLRRIQLALVGSVLGFWAYYVALAVYAYEAGGAAGVGLVALIRTIPSALASPFTALLADRYARRLVMLVTTFLRAATVAAAALVALTDGPAAVVYVLAGLMTVFSTAFRPAQAALLPSLAATPQELTAANVSAKMIESVGVFAGPALGGLLLATGEAGIVFAATAVTLVWALLLLARLDVRGVPGVRPTGGRPARFDPFAGFRQIAGEARLRLLVGLAAAQTLVAGAFNVLIIVAAFDLLDLGNSGVGFLNSALGIGGFVGVLTTLVLIGRQRLASDFGIGILFWGVPIALIGIFPNSSLTLVLLVVVGAANTVVDVSALTLLQRSVPDEMLARVFGVLQSLMIGTLGLGAILAPLAVELAGTRAALVGTGAVLPILTALFWRSLSAIDREARTPATVDLLARNGIFAPLPAPVLESLAGKLTAVERSAGQVVFRQGDHGDRFYVVEEGDVDVTIDGRPVRRLGRGEGFGEIALLRDVPRTATVTAAGDVTLHTLERDDFIAAVTGHAESAEAAEAVVASRLGRLRPEFGPV
ncbi:MAG: MFS transporter [Thermoleophilia bacterium]|nr:MFS transporter [Thermoleophilia bacterium]